MVFSSLQMRRWFFSQEFSVIAIFSNTVGLNHLSSDGGEFWHLYIGHLHPKARGAASRLGLPSPGPRSAAVLRPPQLQRGGRLGTAIVATGSKALPHSGCRPGSSGRRVDHLYRSRVLSLESPKTCATSPFFRCYAHGRSFQSGRSVLQLQ